MREILFIKIVNSYHSERMLSFWVIFIKYMIEWHVHYCVVNVSNIADAQQYLMTKWKCCLFRKKRGATAVGRESSQSQWEDPLRMMETQGENVMDYLDA